MVFLLIFYFLSVEDTDFLERLRSNGSSGDPNFLLYENLPHLLLGLKFAEIEPVVLKWLRETEFLER